MLERVDVQGDRQRREIGRCVRRIGDDPLDPPGPVGDDLPTAQIAVRDRLLQQRSEKVQHVGRAGDDALVHEELGGRRRRQVGLLRDRSEPGGVSERAAGTARDGTARRSPREPPRIIPAMLLAIDIGNSNITIGLVRNGALIATRRAATPARATTDELELLLEELLRLDDASFADVDAVACASVVPSLTAHIEAIAARRDRALTVATSGTVHIAIRTERPGEVGADRLVNALAAGRLYGTPAVVVDFGTATTFDCIAADG